MDSNRSSGYIAALSAYLIWGILPVYWKLLGAVPPLELLAWRIAGCGIVAWGVIALRSKPLNTRFLNRRTILRLVLAAVLITGNWGLYIWAVASERILEASLGYYINPLVNVILGVVFFSEKLGRMRLAALGLALVGVVLMTLDAGTVPWVSLLLALQFGFYGLAVKGLPEEMDSIEVLAWETMLLSPVAAGYLVYLGIAGRIHYTGFGVEVTVLLSLAGIVTLVPLWAFGVGAKRIPLGALGFLQYVAPTMMLLLGTLLYGEAFGTFRAAAFGFVVVALVLYSLTLRRK